jgi:hypothetical protein
MFYTLKSGLKGLLYHPVLQEHISSEECLLRLVQTHCLFLPASGNSGVLQDAETASRNNKNFSTASKVCGKGGQEHEARMNA